MNRFYHERFFSDVRFTATVIVALFVIGAWSVPTAYLLIPPVALLGAVQTAFDASYLIFSRHYSSVLELRLNEASGTRVLVAADMENTYLFPLNQRKIVTFAPAHFTWFGFMTLFYTAAGVASFGFGMALGWSSLANAGDGWVAAYLMVLAVLLVSSLGVGWWWFAAGNGEAKISDVVEQVSLTHQV